MKKTIIFCVLLLLSPIFIQAQELAPIVLSKERAESLLLENNLSLLAKQLDLDIAEAEVIQAKVWPNPTLSIDEINLWTTDYQKRNGEQLATLFGNDNGQYQQVTAQIEQLVELAGKRKKRIAIEQVSHQIAAAYLEDFLLSLRTEFRETLYHFEYSRLYIDLLKKQSQSLESLISAYQDQFNQGNVSKVDLIRLQATNFSLKNEIIDEQDDFNEQQQRLIVLLNLPDQSNISFSNVFDDSFNYTNENLIFNIEDLQQKAIELQPLIKATNLAVKKSEHQLAFEKAQRVPDVTFSVGYDRGGNIYQDFIGVGFSMDLPFFDRNKGGIKRASAEIKQAEHLQSEAILTVKTKVREKVKNILQVSNFFESINPEYVNDLDTSMTAYNQFFKDQTINIITYLDFMEAYIENMQTIYENQKQFYNALEELNYITGLNYQH